MREVKERLNISLSGCYALVARKLLPVVATGAGGKGYRVTEADLAAFIESRKRGRGPDTWPQRADPRSPRLFKHLDGERLRAAWREQGVE
jgi:hypothetical protein